MSGKPKTKRDPGPNEIAKMLGLSPRTVTKYIDNGMLRGYRVPGSLFRRVQLKEVERFALEHNIPLNGQWPPTDDVVNIKETPTCTAANESPSAG